MQEYVFMDYFFSSSFYLFTTLAIFTPYIQVYDKFKFIVLKGVELIPMSNDIQIYAELLQEKSIDESKYNLNLERHM